ncbi:MAG: hypothetical protein ACRC8Y_04360 [Chroococcales cyanobacterium]
MESRQNLNYARGDRPFNAIASKCVTKNSLTWACSTHNKAGD